MELRRDYFGNGDIVGECGKRLKKLKVKGQANARNIRRQAGQKSIVIASSSTQAPVLFSLIKKLFCNRCSLFCLPNFSLISFLKLAFNIVFILFDVVPLKRAHYCLGNVGEMVADLLQVIDEV